MAGGERPPDRFAAHRAASGGSHRGEAAPSRRLRLPLEYAQTSGANFVTARALEAARTRTSVTEPHQSFDHQRLWADLLWSPALAFNLFGDLAADGARGTRALRALWPDTPGSVAAVRFAHSPGRLDRAYTNSLRAFDAAFALDLGDTEGVVGVSVRYHEWSKPELPRPENLSRYLEVAERSGAFAPRATDELDGRSGLAVMWLEHLLLLSMLQHGSGAWTWGRYVVVHPVGNSDIADACARYRELLDDDSTFASLTLEELLDAAVLPARTGRSARPLSVGPLITRFG